MSAPRVKSFVNRFIIVPIIVFVFITASSSAWAIDLVNTSSGRSERLSGTLDSSGWTLVMLWAHDCIPCERQKPLIEKYYRQNKNRGFSVVGVSTDSKALRAKAISTYQSSKTSFSNFYFEGSNFSDSYKIYTGREFLGTPTYLVYGPNGQLRGTHTGTLNHEMLDKQFGPILKEPTFTPSVDLLR